ncbi:MAG: ATP-binding cassette domain-containing protein, partial [Ktedonobacteraceae bacterium]|nr:ATP-binding cassette domain-containing protein [Ktedonobacteraceae bacterium]
IQAYRAEVLPQVGALIEQPALYGYMSGRDNLRAFATALGGVAEQRIDEVLEIVALKGRQKDRVRTYSLGMKQRLGIAVALLHDPQLLILDEPANGLDPAGIVEMRDFLHRLVDAGKTILISSHLLAEVQQICTRVAIINFGKLVAETSLEDLTKGAGDFKVAVERPAEALALIKSQTWGSQAYIDEAGYVITPSPDGQGRGLIAFLSHFGFVPDSVSPAERNLEQVFLQLTNGVTGI